jgi:hypothetical protein
LCVWEINVYSKEIITGEVPFASMCPRNEQVIINVVTGKIRPDRPKLTECTDLLWELLSSCWQENASARPPIGVAMQKLEQVTCDYRPLRVLLIGIRPFSTEFCVPIELFQITMLLPQWCPCSIIYAN